MPVVVDHGERREAAIEVATQVPVAHGPTGVTVREVARAAGFSTAVVSHYCRDTDVCLRWCPGALSSRRRPARIARRHAVVDSALAPLYRAPRAETARPRAIARG